MRLIAAVRLSRTTETTTSVDTQTIGLEEYARRQGHTIVATTTDLDISGGTEISKRPGVGPWLAPERLGEWDALAGYVIDRMFRNHYDFVKTWHEVLKPNGKKLIAVSEDIDMSTDTGEMMANLRVMFAQAELRKMSERRKRAVAHLLTEGRYPGGHQAYGYMPIPNPDGKGFILIPEPQAQALIQEIASKFISGMSARAIANELNDRGIPSPKGKSWRGEPILRMMRSDTLRGYVVSPGSGGIARDSDGIAIRREPLIPDDIWAELQTALQRLSVVKSAHRINASLLLRVAFCGQCSAPLYLARRTDRSYNYYSCGGRIRQNNCTARITRQDILESVIEDRLLEELGEVPMQLKKVIPGEDNSKQIAELEEGIANLEAQAVDDPLKADTYVRMIGKLEDRRDKLAALPVREESSEWVPVEPRKTFAAHWDSLDTQGRHSFLLRSKVRIFVRHLDPDEPVYLPVPDPRPQGTVVRLVGHGLQITLYLGELGELRDRAAHLR